MSDIFREFADIHELMAAATWRTNEYPPESKGHKKRQEWMFGPDWKDIESTREGLTIGRAPESVERVYESARQSIAASMQTSDALGVTRRRVRLFGQDGDSIDTDRYLAGRPECWESSRVGKAARIVRIGFNVCASWGNDASAYAQLAANCAAVSDWLTVRGFGVEIVALAASMQENEKDGWCFRWIVKRATDPLDVSAIMAHGCPGVSRSVVFGLAEELMPNLGWNGPCAFEWTAEAKARVGVDYVIARVWSDRQQCELAEGIEK